MEFNKSILPLGTGRLLCARVKDGAAEILCDTGGETVIKKVDLSSKAVKTGDAVSYADHCLFCGSGLLEKGADGFAFAELKNRS